MRRGTGRLVVTTAAAAATACYGCRASVSKASLNRTCQVSMYTFTFLTSNPIHNPLRSRHVSTKRRNYEAHSAPRVRRLGTRFVAEVSSSAVLQLPSLVGVRHGRSITHKKSNGQKLTHWVWQMHILIRVIAAGRGVKKQIVEWRTTTQRWLRMESACFVYLV